MSADSSRHSESKDVTRQGATGETTLAGRDERLRVRVESGSILGMREERARVFRAIPYAAPPVGARRFAEPEPPLPWPGTRDAARARAPCPQHGSPSDVGEEDCLTLDVFAPVEAKAARLPVLVFIPGEFYGDGFVAPHARFAHYGDAILVVLQSRLGPLGYLAHPALRATSTQKTTGNYGLLDQVFALRWVKRNISAFGGDPAHVAVVGHSAGAVSVCALLASPQAEGLFSAAILQSGRCTAKRREDAEAQGVKLAEELGCRGGGPQAVDCMRAAPLAAWMNIVPKAAPLSRPSLDHFQSTLDDYALPIPPLEATPHVPVMIGSTAYETGALPADMRLEGVGDYDLALDAFFRDYGAAGPTRLRRFYLPDASVSAKQAWVRATTDGKFFCPAEAAADAFAGRGAQVFLYRFDRVPGRASKELRAKGAFHGSELRFLFDRLDGDAAADDPEKKPHPEDLRLAARMHHDWVEFAKSGNPSSDGPPTYGPAWPRYRLSDRRHLLWNTPPREEGRGAICSLWADVKTLRVPPSSAE